MSNIDLSALATAMLNAARAPLAAQWRAVEPYAQGEMEKLATTALQIKAGIDNKTITPQVAKILLNMQSNASQAVLTTVETVGLIAAQNAINAALNVLVAAVNKAIGAAIL